MPHILSIPLTQDLPGLFGEGAPYTRTSIIDITKNDPALPPVNYDEHHLKPHSMPHVDAPGHVIAGGESVDVYYRSRLANLYGPVVVLRLPGERWESAGESAKCWRVSEAELRQALRETIGSDRIPSKLFIAPAKIPENSFGQHRAEYAFVLEEAAAKWLVGEPKFNAYGTSWRTSDFQPSAPRERPVHKILLPKAVILECLDLRHVPAGEYFLTAFPIHLSGATESPVCPVLFERGELNF